MSGVLVAVVVQVVAQVVGQTTAGVPDTAVFERELLRVAGRADPIVGALELLATYDVTKGQLLLQTVRQSLRRLGTLPSTGTGSSTTTTTEPPRATPAPGSVDVAIGTT